MPKPPYTVDVRERIANILGDTELNEESELRYSYDQGYEKLFFRSSPKHGSLEYAGVYHPNIVCEGGGACTYCGRTLIFD